MASRPDSTPKQRILEERASSMGISVGERVPRWRAVLLRSGHWQAVGIITLMSVLVSVLVTMAVVLSMGSVETLPMDLTVAVLVPLVVAPLVSHRAMGLLYEVEEARVLLHQLAIRDGLTQLYNRRFFMGKLDIELERARREGSPLSVLLMDLDHFKSINDRFGHATGDEVLARFASVLMEATHPYDLVARHGGEEFVALLPGASLKEAQGVAERVREAAQDIRFTLPGNGSHTEHGLTVSVGISGPGGGEESASALLERADRAVYAAKAAGRNRTVCIPPGDGAEWGDGRGWDPPESGRGRPDATERGDETWNPPLSQGAPTLGGHPGGGEEGDQGGR
jgi:diguanylate cyclase (GGDEF)-like protein